MRFIAIPLAARIMALTDAYDAMRSRRVYKPAFSHEESVPIIGRGAGRHFDTAMVAVFAEHQRAFAELFDRAAAASEAAC